MSLKEKIELQFSKAASTYDQVTEIQKEVVDKLVSILPEEDFSRILEIGAGTGYLTDILLDKYKNSDLLVNDISEDMLSVLEKKISTPRITLLKRDGEKLDLIKNNYYDLITSASTFQWFQNYKKTFINYERLLRPGGYLSFTMFGKNTFIQLKNLYREIFPNYKFGPQIPCFEEILHYLEAAGFKIYSKEKVTQTRYFDSIKEILRIQKLSGAVNPYSNGLMTARSLKRISEAYSVRYKIGNRLPLDYEFYYITAKSFL